MTSQEMMKTEAKPGMCWTNVAPIDAAPDWREVPNPHGPHSDPNYGHDKLFGYNQTAFLAKQYR